MATCSDYIPDMWRNNSNLRLCASQCSLHRYHIVCIGLIFEQQANILGPEDISEDPRVDHADRHFRLWWTTSIEGADEHLSGHHCDAATEPRTAVSAIQSYFWSLELGNGGAERDILSHAPARASARADQLMQEQILLRPPSRHRVLTRQGFPFWRHAVCF